MDGHAAALTITKLTRAFGKTVVLKDVNLRLEPGERLGVAGANGSGKTTLLRCIAGSLTPTRGAIEVAGHPAGSMPARAATGMVTANEKAFYQRLSGRRNLTFYASIRGGSAEARAESLIEELSIDFADQRVDRYSSGMLQQLSFARALLGDPRLLLLDEPTRSLDSAAVDRLWAALARRPSVALAMTSHRASDLERCEQRIAL
jgi:ABC-type multidrug transport system ATPase subunit